MPRDDLAVLGVDDESAAHDVAVPAGELEAIAAPPQVRPHDDDLAVMDMLGPLGIFPRQQQVMGLHDPVDPLVVDQRKILGPQLSVQDRRDPAAAIGRARCNERRDHRHHRRVLRFVIAPTRPGPALQPVNEVERAMPGVSATTFTGNRPPAATARARSVFLSVTCPRPRAGFRPPASCGRAAAQARERGPPAAEQRDGDVIIPGHGNAPPLQA